MGGDASSLLPQKRPWREAELRLRPAVGGPGQSGVVVDRFLARRHQRVFHARALGLRRIDPPGEGRQPFGHGQGIVVDDIVDPWFGRERGDRRGDRVVDVDERPDGISFPDDR